MSSSSPDQQPEQPGEFQQEDTGLNGVQNDRISPYEFYFYSAELGPQRKPKGALYWTVMVAGLMASLVLLFGAVSLFAQNVMFDSDGGPSSATEQESAQTPELSGTGQDLADELDHIHEGIDVDWDAGLSYDGEEVDTGQRVDSAPGVFLVDSMLQQGFGSGTGFVLSPDGLALTNYHVVEDSSSLTVQMADSGETHEATVLGRDHARDIAVLQIEGVENLPVSSLNTEPPEYRDVNAAVGNGSGQGYLTSVTGEITGLDRSIVATGERAESESELEGLMETTADVVPGYSGGPLVDENGQVIGISVAASPGETTDKVYGYAIPITVGLDIADQVLSGEETETVSIGVDGALGITVVTGENGATIYEVSPGSAAEELGLREGDTVLTVEGEEVTNASELSRAINDRNVGDVVSVSWIDTAGNQHTDTAVLQEAIVN